MTDPPAVALVATRLAAVRERIRGAAELADRDPSAIRVVAVTKGHPAEAIEAALGAGLHDIGESRVQEAQAKWTAIPQGSARWHMIGHVQRNKARAAAAMFDSVHSVDSIALVEALARHRDAESPPLDVYVEVELTGLPRRTGVRASDAPALLEAILRSDRLAAAGLMTVAAPAPAEAVGACFERLRSLRDQLRASHRAALPELSMGMSDDFEAAVAHGATILRLGRVLFGDRSGPVAPARLS